MRVVLNIIVSKDNVIGGAGCRRNNVERILSLQAPQINTAIHPTTMKITIINELAKCKPQ